MKTKIRSPCSFFLFKTLQIKNKNTKTGESETPVFYVFIKLFMKLEKYKGQKSALKRTKKLAKGKGLHDMMVST